MVHHRVEPRPTPPGLHQVPHEAGVDVAAPGAHDEPRGRRKAHRRVDRPAAVDRRQARPGPQVEPGRHAPAPSPAPATRSSSPMRRRTTGRGNRQRRTPGRLEPAGDRHDPGDPRQVVVERRVEARDLGQGRSSRRNASIRSSFPAGGRVVGPIRRSSASNSSVTGAGREYRPPPCTTRCPTAASAASPTSRPTQSTSSPAAACWSCASTPASWGVPADHRWRPVVHRKGRSARSGPRPAARAARPGRRARTSGWRTRR